MSGGTPIAVVYRTSDGSGIQNATWTPGTTYLTYKSDCLKVTLYVRFGDEAWTAKASWITGQLQYIQVLPETWQFSVWTSRVYTTQTTAMFRFGSAAANSLIDGVNLKSPNVYELISYYWTNGDLVMAIVYVYMAPLGAFSPLFWGLILLLIGGTLYLRYHSFTPLLLLIILFGGAGGYFNLLVPDAGLTIVWLLVLFALGGLYYKVFR
jgi:hypothetical protein